jgi:cupin 2 domain-containing protein
MGQPTNWIGDGVIMRDRSSLPMTLANLFAGVTAHGADEQLTTLFAAGKVRIERIVSHGHRSAPDFWYDQDEHEWVAVLRGAARLRFEANDTTIELKCGDFIHIAAHVRHRVDWTTPEEPTIWLAIFHE